MTFLKKRTLKFLPRFKQETRRLEENLELIASEKS